VKIKIKTLTGTKAAENFSARPVTKKTVSEEHTGRLLLINIQWSVPKAMDGIVCCERPMHHFTSSQTGFASPF
jgi:hypothetical protein